MSLSDKLKNHEARVGVIGLGYVGLPLVVEMAEAGFEVVGIDSDPRKVSEINEGRSYIGDVKTETLAALVKAGKISATTDTSILAELDTVSICVPTPLSKTKDPDVSYILSAVGSIKTHLKSGQLIVLESTTYPGTTDELIRAELESEKFRAGKDFFLAFSPERIDPGNKTHGTRNTPKVVGGITPRCTELAVLLYSQFIKTVVPVSSARTAEMVKLLENTFRSVNIGLVNELASMCDTLGVDAYEVIDAAATKPFGYMPFHPGPGLGGHCIPIDPFYLSWKANQVGIKTKFIELAGEINCSMPEYVVGKVAKALSAENKAVHESRILLLGLAYKPNIDDTRESPSFVLIDTLSSIGAEIDYYDPHINEVPKIRKYPELSGKKSVNWNKEVLGSYDLVLISTAHDVVNYYELGQWASIIVDTRNVMASVNSVKANVYIS